MGLISNSQMIQIREAIKSVTDTFATTPIRIYEVQVVDDLYNEDRGSRECKVWDVNALVEYGDTDSEVVDEAGSIDYNESKLTLNVDDLVVMGMVIPNPNGDGTYITNVKSERDYFELKGVMYQMTDVVFDGPLEKREVLLIIRGEKTQKINEFNVINNGGT